MTDPDETTSNHNAAEAEASIKGFEVFNA